MKSNIILILIALVLYSCVRSIPDEELTMARTPYTGKEIRLDGYFTGVSPGQDKYYDYIFFYSNGVAFSFGNLRDIDLNLYLKGNAGKTYWSIFRVENNTIHVQGWINLGSGFFGVSQLTVEDKYYIILNDTTLYYDASNGYKTKYYFKKFSSKPDSTNVFIK